MVRRKYTQVYIIFTVGFSPSYSIMISQLAVKEISITNMISKESK